jgi:RNA polymerase sigma-70 factor (ECF subfamily)
MPVSTTDAALVSAVAAGDREALADLYDRCAGGLLGLAQRLLGDRHEAEDLVHDVFIEVWKQAGAYDERRGSVRTWFFTRLRARCLDRLRARRLLLAAARANDREPAADHELAPDRATLRGALRKLTAEQADVVALAYYEGLSSTEISARLGIPVGTVKSRTAAALGRLRRVVPADAAMGGPP